MLDRDSPQAIDEIIGAQRDTSSLSCGEAIDPLILIKEEAQLAQLRARYNVIEERANEISSSLPEKGPRRTSIDRLIGGIVVIARVIQWPVALEMVRVSGITLAVAQRRLLWPRAGLALLALGERCARLARRML